MSKELCKLKKSCQDNFDMYILLVNQPRFVCTNCGRAANDKKSLCEPKKIKKSALKLATA